jgi:O-methyltransferase
MPNLQRIHGNKTAAAVLNQSRGIKMALATNKEPIVHQSEALLYLDLLKRCLINIIYEDNSILPRSPEKKMTEFDRDLRLSGLDWPSRAHTMIGWQRLDNIQALANDVLLSGIEGDFIETGVWRGGATIFMRGILKAYGVEDRTVWVADSFCGFPDPQQTSPRSYSSPEIKEITGNSPEERLALEPVKEVLREGTQLESVKQNFERYNLLDQQVRFLPGWFSRDTPESAYLKTGTFKVGRGPL